jgi:hypothetical protein
MFWVMFDTSTRRDYYRDVHNLLALPPGSTLRYDYGEYHVSSAAKEEAEKGDASSKMVLIAYAQSKSFEKGAQIQPARLHMITESGSERESRI